jgi:membrane protein DedA with SNARE-associated domain
MDPTIQYLTVSGLALITWIGVPAAGDAALVTAALLAAQGRLSISVVLISAFIGANVGGWIGYRLGFDGGRTLVVEPGPFLDFRRKLLTRADRVFERFGRIGSVVALPVMCGINRVPLGAFIPFSMIGRLGWVLITGGVAYVVGEDIVLLLKQVGVPAIATITVIVAVVAGLRYAWAQRDPAAVAPAG